MSIHYTDKSSSKCFLKYLANDTTNILHACSGINRENPDFYQEIPDGNFRREMKKNGE